MRAAAALEAEERKTRGKLRQLKGAAAVMALREQEVQLEIQQGTAALTEAHKQLQAIKALAQKRNALRRDP